MFLVAVFVHVSEAYDEFDLAYVKTSPPRGCG